MVTRRDVRAFIRSYPPHPAGDKVWYQNIRFLPLLETRRSVVDIALARLRGAQRREELLISHLPRLDGMRVLEIGCNAGLYSLEASCRGAASVLGVDQEPFRIRQAGDVADAFRRLGRPVGQVAFRQVDDINNHLDLIADADVIIAACVLYHLGPLDRLKAAIRDSPVRTLILQGNRNRYRSAQLPTHPKRPRESAEDVSSVEGLRRFCESMGFTPHVAIDHASPLVIATRERH